MRPSSIAETLDTLELTPVLLQQREKRKSRPVAFPPLHLPLLLEVHLPLGAGLDVRAIDLGEVEWLHNLISPLVQVNQPSGAPLEGQVWIVGRPDSEDVRLLQLVLPCSPELDTTMLIRPTNPWLDAPAPRLTPPAELQEIVDLFWPPEDGDDE